VCDRERAKHDVADRFMSTLTATLPEMVAWMHMVLWPFLRISAMFSVAPVLGSRTIPVRVRIAMATVLSVALAPSLDVGSPPDPLSATGLVAVATQLAIGLSMGFALQIVFAALHMAGELVATTMGLSMAQVTDPVNGVQVAAVGQLFYMIGTLVFLALDGHLALLAMLFESFRHMPVGSAPGMEDLWALLQWAGLLFTTAMQVALPAVTALLAANVMLGVITRSAPQLNLFAFGLPITTVLGLSMLVLVMPELAPALARSLESAGALITDVYLR
jgi:flagellar biosynthetic protein FliR